MRTSDWSSDVCSSDLSIVATLDDEVVACSHVLLAVGRVPNTADLGLDKDGVEVDECGYITVDDELRTSAPGIWALGDCNGRGAFTHTAYNELEIIAANLLDGEHPHVDRKRDVTGTRVLEREAHGGR